MTIRGILLALLLLSPLPAVADEPLVVGSKKFTESVVLGEIVAGLWEGSGIPAAHRRELGGTRVLWNALLRGDIDAYPEYTGTLLQEIFAGEEGTGPEDLVRLLEERGVRMTGPLGFDNTYAIGMNEAVGDSLGVRTISDLKRHSDLRLGFTNEFMDRGDGWPSLRTRYGLPHRDVRGLDHDLAYRGLASGTLDALDLYSTDAEIDYYGLRVLEDDLRHFPEYLALVLYRADLEVNAPDAVKALRRLEGTIDGAAMTGMNRRVKIDGQPEGAVAAAFLGERLSLVVVPEETTFTGRLLRRTREHLAMVGLSLAAAVVVALPLGIGAAKWRRFGQGILGFVGIVQTIPSLALLVFMIPLLGIGGPPAVAALFLYSLLPIVRNTHAGLTHIPVEIRESAEAIGLTPAARLRHVELPMASPSILAGIKTSAVINVGTATLGALIGAGGYGQPILTGIRLDDSALILQGAVPAAVLALATQGLFEGAERLVVPAGLRDRRD